MSRTIKHNKQRDLKTKLQQRKVELHNSGVDIMFDDVSRGLNSEFSRGASRYGNKRHYESYMKWKKRKADRYAGRNELNENISAGLPRTPDKGGG